MGTKWTQFPQTITNLMNKTQMKIWVPKKIGEQMNKQNFCPPKSAKMGDFSSSHKPLPNPRGVLHSRNHLIFYQSLFLL